MTRRREIMLRILEALGLEPSKGETCEEMGERIVERAEELQQQRRDDEDEEDAQELEREKEQRRQQREHAHIPQLVASSEGPRKVDPSQVPPPKRGRKRRHEGQAGLGL